MTDQYVHMQQVTLILFDPQSYFISFPTSFSCLLQITKAPNIIKLNGVDNTVVKLNVTFMSNDDYHCISNNMMYIFRET